MYLKSLTPAVKQKIAGTVLISQTMATCLT